MDKKNKTKQSLDDVFGFGINKEVDEVVKEPTDGYIEESIEDLEKQVDSMKIDVIGKISLHYEEKVVETQSNIIERKLPDTVTGIDVMRDNDLLKTNTTIEDDIDWIKTHVDDVFGIEDFYSQLIKNIVFINKQIASYQNSEDKGLLNAAVKNKVNNESLLAQAKKMKTRITLVKDSIGLTSGNITRNIWTYLLWYTKGRASEFNPAMFLVNTFDEEDNNLRKVLIDLAIGVLTAFKETDLINMIISKQEVKNKLYNVFFSHKFNDSRIKFEGIQKEALKKRIANKFGFDKDVKKEWLQELLILLNTVFEIDSNSTLSNDELADIVFEVNSVLPTTIIHNEPYTKEFLHELFNMQSLRSEFAVNYSDVRTIIDSINSLTGLISSMVGNNSSTTALTKSINGLNVTLAQLTDFVKQEDSKDNLIIINDFLNNPVEAERRLSNGANSKEFYINENVEYENLIKKEGSLNFFVTNNENDFFLIKENGKIVKRPLSNLLFKTEELQGIKQYVDNDDIRGVIINEYFTKGWNK